MRSKQIISALFIFVCAYGFAVNKWWTDAGTDVKHSWGNGANWNDGVQPSSSDDAYIGLVALSPGDYPQVYTSGRVCNNMYLGWGNYAQCWIHGPGALTTSGLINIGSQNTTGYLVVTGGRLNVGTELRLGAQSGSQAFVKINGGRVNVAGSVKIPFDVNASYAQLELEAGTIYCNDLTMTSVGRIYITGGQIVINGDKTSTVNNYKNNGWITTFNEGQILIDYNATYSGKTTIRCASLRHPVTPMTHLWLVDYADIADSHEWVALSTLQGFLAMRNHPERIYLYKTGVNSLWVDELTSKYGITATNVDVYRGALSPLQWLLDRYRNDLDGYILYDEQSNKKSLSVATSLAGPMNAIAANATIESIVSGRGLSRIMDVRTRDDQWLYNNYRDYFRNNGICVKTNDTINSNGRRMSDINVAFNMIRSWDANTTFTTALYNSIVRVSPCYGWLDAAYSDEIDAVRYHIEKGLYTMPADTSVNYSVFAAMAYKSGGWSFTQNLPSHTSFTKVDNKHHVTFIHTDMDNLGMLISQDGWAQSADRYGSPYRGQFCMGWGMPVGLYYLAPHVVKWWYDNAYQNKDCFVVPFSGIGYHFPSKLTSADMDRQKNMLDWLMNQLDLRAVVINDPYALGGGSTAMSKFAAMSAARGFFVSGNPYHQYGKAIEWSGGKPFISVRYSLWDGYETASSLASKLNASSTNAYDEAGYSVVMVHAWSRTLTDVKNCIAALNSNVRVVTPEELIEQVRLHNVP